MLHRKERAEPVTWGMARLRPLIISALSAVSLLGFSPRLLAQDVMHPERIEARARLAQVLAWGCQYQNIEPDRIAGSLLDLVVIDPILDGATGRAADRSDVEGLQRKPDGSRRLVFAYLSVGAAEEYRPYWQAAWRSAPPPWLGPANPDWPLSYSVRYWHSEWRQLVSESLMRIVDAGFDGVFMDRVDGFHDWRHKGDTVLDDMADLIADLAGRARKARPGFLMIGQNAEPLLRRQKYVAAIDGVSKESLLTGLQGEGNANRDDQIDWSMIYLVPAQNAGLTVLAIEYLQSPSDIATVGARHRDLGFIPFFATRLLDRLP